MKLKLLSHQRFLQVLFALLGMWLAVPHAEAQDVSVSPKTGDMIPALQDASLSTGSELGWGSGAFALWRHNQLPLSVTVGDAGDLNPDGLLALHANNLYANTTANVTPNEDTSGDTYFTMVAGNAWPGYMTISLPRGMRFTRYTIVLKNNVTSCGTFNTTSSNFPINTTNPITFAECTVSGTGASSVWTERTDAGTHVDMGRTGNASDNNDGVNAQTYTISRTSTSSGDMGNVLYFMLNDGETTETTDSKFQSCAIKSIILEFTSEAPFTTTIAPTASNTTGASFFNTSFYTGKQDLGYIMERTDDNGQNARNGYFQGDVKDLQANMWLYEPDAIQSGVFPTAEDNNRAKTISRVLGGNSNAQQGYFYFQPSGDQNTYYIETPDRTHDQFGNDIMLDYRITGATFHYTNQIDAAAAQAGVEGGTYITYTDNNGTVYYLQADGMNWRSGDENKVVWTSRNNKLFVNNNGTINYLKYEGTGTSTTYNNDTYYSTSSTFYLTTTTNASEATDFTVGGDITCNVNYYYNDGDNNYGTTTLTLSTYTVSSSDQHLVLTDEPHPTYASITPIYSGSSRYYITYKPGNTTYYLQADGDWGEDQVSWTMDNNNRLYRGSGYNRAYLYVGQTNDGTRFLRTSSYYASRFTITNDNKLSYSDNNDVTYYLTTSTASISIGSTSSDYPLFTPYATAAYAPSYKTVESIEGSEAQTARTLDPYTLTIYDKDGQTIAQTINVTGNGDYTLTGLNNDAVKFSLSGPGLVYVDLQMEYLNPFIQQMNVKLANEDNKDIAFTQTFTATDFAVGGGQVSFAVPQDLVGKKFDVTFDNLRSNYADETYTGLGGSNLHRSRYNFVKSDYFNLHNDGATEGDAAISFMGSNNLYLDTKNVADYDYTKKVSVDVAGNVPFKFNNAATYADEIAKSAEGRTTLREYLFTLDHYAHQTTLSGATSDGAFQKVVLTPTSGSTVNDDAYLFVSDETRYNIAPTTEVQHRMHAFYDVRINVNVTTYNTTATLKPIYNSSFYDDKGQGKLYGATIATTNTGSNGYSSVQSVIDAVKTAAGSTVGLDKILYLDMSGLDGVYTTSADAATDWDAINSTLTAKNLLVFLPKNTTLARNNYAYAELGAQGTSSFRSGANVVITDKQPFYTPYDIHMSATNYARYDRLVSNSKNGKVAWATLMLPFVLKDVSNGQYTEANGTKITLYEMNPTNAINKVNRAVPDGYFSAITESSTASNAPYVLHVDEDKASSDDVSFSLTQYGSDIFKTPLDPGTNGLDDVTITSGNNPSTGTVDNDTYTFTMVSNYAGQELDKNGNYFYFARDGFYCSHNLASRYSTVKFLPFRAYYTYTTASGRNTLSRFHIALGENPEATGISDIVVDPTQQDITAGKGTITIKAAEGNLYRVFSVAGQEVNSLYLNAGEERTISVPAGIYIVNDVKIMVR